MSRHSSCVDVLMCPAAIGLAVYGLAGITFAQPSLTNLGVLPNRTATYADAINADGTVIVGQASSAIGGSAFRWTRGGGIVDIGNYNGGFSGFGNALSANGQVVAGTESSNSTVWRWTVGGGYQPLTTPGGYTDPGVGGMSADGSVVVGSAVSGGNSRAVRWASPTTPQVLPLLPGTTLSYSVGCSASGSVVIGSARAAGNAAVAFRWADGPGGGTIQDLGTPSGTSDPFATGVSQDGSVIVGHAFTTAAPFGSRSFRWTSGGFQPLGLPSGFTSVRANAVSGDGNRIVGVMSSPASGDIPFLWTAQAGVVDLRMYLTGLGVSLSGWSLNEASAISADGTAITGIGVFNGQQTSWVASGLPIPTPGAGLVLGVGGVIAFRRRRG
ncbi:MAG: hypothetical protein K2Q20_07020 [Phycisphaerales bacterium]|nr:hypothetical protein [Phycisphaerales bacterium]